MVISVSDAIAAESFFKITVGTGGKITSEQLTLLETYVADDVINFIGSRIVSTDIKTRITACFILDLYANKGGKGTIIKESVKDSSWQANIKTTSQYMDRAYTLRDNAENTQEAFDLSGVTRDDASIAIERDNELSRLIFG